MLFFILTEFFPTIIVSRCQNKMWVLTELFSLLCYTSKRHSHQAVTINGPNKIVTRDLEFMKILLSGFVWGSESQFNTTKSNAKII